MNADSDKKMSRRAFIKFLGSTLAVIITAKFTQIMSQVSSPRQSKDPNSYGNSTYGGGNK